MRLNHYSEFWEGFQKFKQMGEYREALSEIINFKEKLKEEIHNNPKLKFEVFAEEGELLYLLREYKNAQKIGRQIISESESENEVYIANALNLLGKIARIHKRYNIAKSYYEHSHKIFSQLNNEEGMAKIIHNQANLNLLIGKIDEAIKLHRNSLEIEKRLHQRDGIFNSHLNIGSCYYQKGELSNAKKEYEEALEIATELENQYYYGLALLNLANVAKIQERLDDSQSLFDQALPIFQGIKDIRGTENCYSGLIDVYSMQNNHSKAKICFEGLISAKKQAKDFKDWGRYLVEFGNTLLKLHENDLAYEKFSRASNLDRIEPRFYLQAVEGMMRIELLKKRFHEAKELCKTQLDFLSFHNDPISTAAVKTNLGKTELLLGEWESGIEHLNQSLKEYQKLNAWQEIVVASEVFLEELLKNFRWKEAEEVIQKYLLPASKKFHNSQLESASFDKIALIQLAKCEFTKATGSIKKALQLLLRKQEDQAFAKSLIPTYIDINILSDVFRHKDPGEFLDRFIRDPQMKEFISIEEVNLRKILVDTSKADHASIKRLIECQTVSNRSKISMILNLAFILPENYREECYQKLEDLSKKANHLLIESRNFQEGDYWVIIRGILDQLRETTKEKRQNITTKSKTIAKEINLPLLEKIGEFLATKEELIPYYGFVLDMHFNQSF